MNVAEIVRADGSQLVKLPKEFQLEGDTVSIRRQGEAIVLEPIKRTTWPPGFFDQIHIDDPAFAASASGGKCPTCSETRLSGPAMRYLLDTNICIAAMRHDACWWCMAALVPVECVISTITTYELYTGIEKCAAPARNSPRSSCYWLRLVNWSSTDGPQEKRRQLRFYSNHRAA